MNAGSTITSRDIRRCATSAPYARRAADAPDGRRRRPGPPATCRWPPKAGASAVAGAIPARVANARCHHHPQAAPAIVVKRMIERAGFIRASFPTHRCLACACRTPVRPSEIAQPELRLRLRRRAPGDLARKVVVGRLGLPLRHQLVAATLADRLRYLGVRILTSPNRRAPVGQAFTQAGLRSCGGSSSS